MAKRPSGARTGTPMLEHVARIQGPFAGVDVLWVLLGVVILAAVLGFTAVIARQVAQLTPKPGAATKARGQEAAKAGAEFESWTERPAEQRNYEADYYSIYGSQPARRGDYRGPNAPAAPAAPGGGDVVATLGAPAAAASGWPAPSEGSAAPPRAHAPFAPPAQPTGPTDEVVAPTHARSARASTGDPWKDLGTARQAETSFERSSTRAGAPPPAPQLQRTPRGQPAPRASPPPPARPAAPRPGAPPAPPPPSAPRPGSARSTFRTPPGRRAVVGGAGVGAKEGDEVAPQRKAIRCPKCSTVFPGPETRPAMVKCPACGTGGVMK